MASKKKTVVSPKRAPKRASPKKPVTMQAKLLDIVQNDDKLRKKLYDRFGRVRIYTYKTGRIKPNPETQAELKKITRGALSGEW